MSARVGGITVLQLLSAVLSGLITTEILSWAAEMPLGAGKVADGQVDDVGCGEGLAACTSMILGLGDGELGEFLAAGHADRSGFEEGQIGQDPGVVRRVVASLQRGFEVGPGAGKHASAAPRSARVSSRCPREAGRLQGQPGVGQAQRIIVGKAFFVRVAAGQQVVGDLRSIGAAVTKCLGEARAGMPCWLDRGWR